MRLLDQLALALLILDGGAEGIAVIVFMFNDSITLWRHADDRQNRAARILFMSACLQRGVVRMLTGFMFSMTPWLLWPAIGTYALEGLFLLALCALTDLVHTWRTLIVGMANLMAMGLLIGVAVTV